MEIKPLSGTDSQVTFDAVSRLFVEMYAFMDDTGLQVSLAENGAVLWANSIKPFLGKLNQVFIALEGDTIVGFAAGNIKVSPAFLGHKKLGYVSHVYVNPNFRKKKSGHLLVSKLINWFNEKEVAQIELEVLHRNTSALKFWEHFGFEVDTIGMRKHLS